MFQIEYHFVWVAKYRYKVLAGEIAERVRELVRETCEAFEIRIVKGVVSKDHVHILVSCPPNMAPSEIMRRIKGRTPLRKGEKLRDKIEQQLVSLQRSPSLVRSFFRAPCVAYIADC